VPTPLTDAAILPAPRAGVLGLLRARALGVPVVSSKRKAVAFTIAALADVVQIVLFPAFIEGAGSPVEDALDAAVALVLLLILGYSHRLLFAFALELVPGADLFPTWTAVVASIPVRAGEPTAAVDRPTPRH
jgi:hypothetical protein